MLAPKTLASNRVISLIWQIGSMVLKARRPLLRGDVIGPAGIIVPESEATALYVTMPVYFPNEFATFADANGDVVVAWLVPITTREADFIACQGWDAFEDRLVVSDPNLADFRRVGMSL